MIIKNILDLMVINSQQNVSRLQLQLLRNASRKNRADLMLKVFFFILVVSLLFK